MGPHTGLLAFCFVLGTCRLEGKGPPGEKACSVVIVDEGSSLAECLGSRQPRVGHEVGPAEVEPDPRVSRIARGRQRERLGSLFGTPHASLSQTQLMVGLSSPSIFLCDPAGQLEGERGRQGHAIVVEGLQDEFAFGIVER